MIYHPNREIYFISGDNNENILNKMASALLSCHEKNANHNPKTLLKRNLIIYAGSVNLSAFIGARHIREKYYSRCGIMPDLKSGAKVTNDEICIITFELNKKINIDLLEQKKKTAIDAHPNAKIYLLPMVSGVIDTSTSNKILERMTWVGAIDNAHIEYLVAYPYMNPASVSTSSSTSTHASSFSAIENFHQQIIGAEKIKTVVLNHDFPSVEKMIQKGITKYLGKDRSIWSSHLPLISAICDNHRGYLRAQIFQNALINQQYTTKQKLLVIYALLSNRDGEELRNTVIAALDFQSINDAKTFFKEKLKPYLDLNEESAERQAANNTISRIIDFVNGLSNYSGVTELPDTVWGDSSAHQYQR